MGAILDQILRMDNLRAAWNAVADNHGAPGPDGITVDRWSRTWEDGCLRLIWAVRDRSYRPSYLRLIRIPKKDPREIRVLRIPNVSDRVLQRAVLNVLIPRYERLFRPCSFGYRPRMGVRQAIERIVILREDGLRWVLDADIDGFFDHIPHKQLVDELGAQLDDPALIALISRWIMIGAVNPGVGISMGSPLSPLLANIYLHVLDSKLEKSGMELTRYADDFIVQCSEEGQVVAAYQTVETILHELSLRYEPRKTCVTHFDQGFIFLGVYFQGSTFEYVSQNRTIHVRNKADHPLLDQYPPEYE